jgi:hypothetical protein
MTLIERLNQMKVEAQLNEQPVLRNLAKLMQMMNSMYGRFGMHLDSEISEFLTLEEINSIAQNHTITSMVRIGDLYLVS